MAEGQRSHADHGPAHARSRRGGARRNLSPRARLSEERPRHSAHFVGVRRAIETLRSLPRYPRRPRRRRSWQERSDRGRADSHGGGIPMSDRDAAGTASSGLGAIAAEMPANQRRARLTSRLSSFRNYGLILGLALIWIAFDIRTDGIFLSQRNLGNLGVQTAITGIAAVSAVMLIVTRNFDLSVGSAVALVGVILAELTITANWPLLPAMGVAVVVGVAMGLWQGWVVARLAVPSFIVTLAGMLYFRGISLIIPNGQTIAPVGPDLSALA